jgi:putative transposase
LGVVEHHSRKLLALVPLRQKRSVNILLALLPLLKYYPKPKQIRTDNERCFTSKLVKFALWFVSIKHQTTPLNSPWVNGRIERLFGTLKSNLALLPKVEDKEFTYLTQSFQYWYNNVRLHQNLEYQTPEVIYYKQIDKLYKEIQHE